MPAKHTSSDVTSSPLPHAPSRPAPNAAAQKAGALKRVDLASFPPPEQWEDWTELDASAWPKRVEKHYSLVPTICFNCEAACGLVAYLDKDQDGRIAKLEGNPFHPGSRGRNCAKGPATLNQVHDPERILYPMKRVGPRGSGEFERTTWDEVLDTIAGRIRKALIEDRKTEVMYHVGRPGARRLHGSHPAVVGRRRSQQPHERLLGKSARLGYAMCVVAVDRPSRPIIANAEVHPPDLARTSRPVTTSTRTPSASIEGKMSAARRSSTVDIRLSNTASHEPTGGYAPSSRHRGR